MSQKLAAMGDTEMDVMTRLGLDDQEFEVSLPLTLQGVGLELVLSVQGVAVHSILFGSAAAKSNSFLKNDILLEINGQSVVNDAGVVSQQLCGPAGDVVLVKMRRSTAKVLLMQRQHILRQLNARVKPLRRVMAHVIGAAAKLTCARMQKTHASGHTLTSKPSSTEATSDTTKSSMPLGMMFLNPKTQMGVICQMELDPRLCKFLHAYEVRLFGSASLSELSHRAVNLLALMDETEWQRLSRHDLEVASYSATVNFLLEQLQEHLTTGRNKLPFDIGMTNLSCEDYLYLCRDVVQEGVRKQLTPASTRFLRLHVPDALARQIHPDQLRLLMRYNFAFNRSPFLPRSEEIKPGGTGALKATHVEVALEEGSTRALRVRPMSGRLRKREGAGKIGGFDGHHEMFHVTFEDVCSLLTVPIPIFMQMGQVPAREMPSGDGSRACLVFGYERKQRGTVFTKVEPFITTVRIDTDQLRGLRSRLEELSDQLREVSPDKAGLLEEQKRVTQKIAEIWLTNAETVSLPFDKYCRVLEDAKGQGGGAGEEEEFRQALEGYREEARTVTNHVYLGWRRFVMMCESGARLSEWARFPAHLLQAAFSAFPHRERLEQAQERVLEQQQEVSMLQDRAEHKQGDTAPLAGNFPPSAESKEVRDQLVSARHELTLRLAQVTELQHMLGLLPWVSASNIQWVLLAAPTLRTMWTQQSGVVEGNEQQHAWQTAFPSAPGALSARIDDVKAATSTTFHLAPGAAAAPVGRHAELLARLETAKRAKDAARTAVLSREIKDLQKSLAALPTRLGEHNAFEGCRVTVYAPGEDRRVLLSSHVSKYDVKKNQVTMSDKFGESLVSVVKEHLRNKEDAAKVLAAAAAAEDAEDDALAGGAAGIKRRGQKPAAPDVMAQFKREQEEQEAAVTYAIPWLDFLVRAVPLCVAAQQDFAAIDVRFLVENCLRVPPSRSLRGCGKWGGGKKTDGRPLGRPQVVFWFGSALQGGFPEQVVAVQLIVDQARAHAAPGNLAPDPAASRSTVLTGAQGSEAGVGASQSTMSQGAEGSAKSSCVLAAGERLIPETGPMPVLRRTEEEGLVASGLWSSTWPRRGDLRCLLQNGEELRCPYSQASGLLPPARVPGPCVYSQLSARDLTLLTAAFRTKRVAMRHWEEYADVCSSGMAAAQALLLEPWKIQYMIDMLPPNIYAQLDAAAVNFLLKHFGQEELALLSVGQESEGGAEDHPLALLDRYTLAMVEEQYQQGLLERECTQHAPHLRVAYYLKDVLAWKRLLPCELYQVSMPNMREKNTKRLCISAPTASTRFAPFMFPLACAVATNLLVTHTDMDAREREGHCL